jgi:hypothetical protein
MDKGYENEALTTLQQFAAGGLKAPSLISIAAVSLLLLYRCILPFALLGHGCRIGHSAVSQVCFFDALGKCGNSSRDAHFRHILTELRQCSTKADSFCAS